MSRQTLLDDLEKYICGKVHRELVPGTLEVHPIPGYGALEIGAHRFCEASPQRVRAVVRYRSLYTYGERKTAHGS
jgi:hypothetical protein